MGPTFRDTLNAVLMPALRKDTHGWHGGHLQEPQYSADWGDYISFAQHLHKRADEDGSDLLLIDTGDRIEGNGLYDGSVPKGEYTFEIFKHQNIDVITSGNHELYLSNSSENEYYKTVPSFKQSYVASNLDIQNPKTGELEPLAPRFRKFTTKNQGIRIITFGFLFNFHGNANNTVVQPVQKTVKEKWFQDAIRTNDIDLFLVAGHVPVRNSVEYDLIYDAIRKVRWDTPIVFFGGHTHIRDYRKWEGNAQGIESGRYMETLGFMSMSGLSTGKKGSVSPVNSALKYERLYIDNNLYSLRHHSGTNKTTFPTEIGTNVSAAITHARKQLNLDNAFGCAPQDFWLNRAPYPSDSSLLTWLEDKVLPATFNGSGGPSIVITNSGALRFDIFKGPFTIDSTFLVSPFTSGFRRAKNIPYKAASQVLQLLNNEGQILLEDLVAMRHGEVDAINHNKLYELAPPLPPVNLESFIAQTPTAHPLFHPEHQIPLADPNVLTHINNDNPTIPGYTTVDDLGSDGDDTIHSRIQFYDVPNCVAANIGFDPADGADPPEIVDLVYNEFVQDWVLLALRYLGVNYAKEDTQSTLDGKTMTDVISDWVGVNWKC
jgi:2',3'-cyclic-nucleotide 2'-phosphodiesterase (5'-nucleotidase family)